MRDVVLGIDFGTSCTSAGALIGDRVELVRDNGDPVVPSVIYVPERGPLEVGQRAAQHHAADPRSIVRSVKRVLGLAANDPLVKRYAAGVAFRIEAANERALFKLPGGAFAPEQLAAAVLTRVRELAEQRFGGQVRKAVITVAAAPPAGYRDAITRAAKIAHLEVVELVAEPIAGALAFGLHAAPARRRLLVLDFGGGTFDACAVVQDGMRFSPVATYGDPLLGGDDFDDALAEGVAGTVHRSHGADLHRDITKWLELRYRCESAKRQLSSRLDAPLAMRDAFVSGGRPRNLELTIDREWAEAKWSELIDRASAVVREVITRASWRYDHVDQVVLIGGTSLIPLFRRTVTSLFGAQKVLSSPEADLAVAVGASLLTARHGETPRQVPTLQAVA